MRNSDSLHRSTRSELTNLVKFTGEDGQQLTRMEAFEILLQGYYVHATDRDGTIHRVSLSGHTEYLEACN